MTAEVTTEVQTWIGLEAAARRIDGSKISNDMEDISVMAEVLTGLGGNGNGSGSGRRHELGVTIAAKRWQ